MSVRIIRYVSRFSEILSVEELVAAAEDDVTGVTQLVLLAHVAHIEELLVVQDEEGAGAVQVGADKHRGEGPNHELLQHEHANDAGSVAQGKGITKGTHVHIIAVLTASDVSPILLGAGLVVAGASLEHIAVKELHAEGDGGLVVLGDATIASIELIEVVLGRGE